MIGDYLWVFLLKWEMKFYYFSEFVSKKTIFIYLAVVVQVTSKWEAVLMISTYISKHCSWKSKSNLKISETFLFFSFE